MLLFPARLGQEATFAVGNPYIRSNINQQEWWYRLNEQWPLFIANYIARETRNAFNIRFCIHFVTRPKLQIFPCRNIVQGRIDPILTIGNESIIISRHCHLTDICPENTDYGLYLSSGRRCYQRYHCLFRVNHVNRFKIHHMYSFKVQYFYFKIYIFHKIRRDISATF